MAGWLGLAGWGWLGLAGSVAGLAVAAAGQAGQVFWKVRLSVLLCCCVAVLLCCWAGCVAGLAVSLGWLCRCRRVAVAVAVLGLSSLVASLRASQH